MALLLPTFLGSNLICFRWSFDRFSAVPPPLPHRSTSGQEMGLPGQISARFKSGELKNRPSGRPKADFEESPNAIRPKSCPVARFPSPQPQHFPRSGLGKGGGVADNSAFGHTRPRRAAQPPAGEKTPYNHKLTADSMATGPRCLGRLNN